MTLQSFVKMILVFLILFLQPNSGCYRQWVPNEGDVGGATNLLTVHMPFRNGYTAQCTQGVNGSYSHRGSATRHDIDLDTPNGRDDLVFAPVSGTAYVHNDPNDGFGRHVNIALGDGTYILLGHLHEIFVRDGTEVGLGQVVAFEGNTGNSDGDHVHMGRHEGDPSRPAGFGRSIDTLSIIAKDESDGSVAARRVTQLTCALAGGHRYTSQLPDVRSHPDGSLVKSPYGADVFIVSDGRYNAFENEEVFWSHNRDFADVILVSDTEMACYADGGSIVTVTQIRGAYDGNAAWLLVGSESDPLRWRQQLHEATWSQVLASWGVYATREADLEQGEDLVERYPLRVGRAPWRDGSLVREESRSDVVLVAGGIAFPILSWDVFLRLGLATQRVHVIPDHALAATVANVGNCVTGQHCIDHAFAESCGASLFGDFGTQTIPPNEEVPPEDSSIDTDPMDSEEGSHETAAPDLVPDPVTRAPLMLDWRTPAGVQAARITLSGVYAPQGVEQWWATLGNTTNADRLTYTHPDMASGDYLRFSVEYVIGNTTTWSCLAPFPPGIVQGAVTATWNGQTLPVAAVADPSSPGCGLRVSIP